MLKRAAAAVLYNPELEPVGGLRRIAVRANQGLFERGIRPPWVLGAEECRAYWASRSEGSDVNEPQNYARKPPAIIDVLDGFWRPEVEPSMSLFEAGCNVGANLHLLRERGYGDVAGCEINPHAIEAMRELYPDLADARIHQGALEDVLPTIPDGAFDVVFSMAVLIHVHPSSHRVFAEMSRIARRYVCVVEAERTTVSYVFARNYRRVFERLGRTELRELEITRERHPDVTAEYWGYTARLFA